uniref:P2Y purinoceptor 2-like n=1 Tax=Myxine glutinosa TaxID=7769 RepID=UPI00358EDB3D
MARANSTATNSCWINEDFLPVLMSPVIILQFILGLLGNCFTIWVTWCHMNRWSSYTVYLFNLALTDLLFVAVMPLRVAYFLSRNDWHLGEVMCDLLIVAFYANMYGSIYFLTCISAERCAAVLRPLHTFQHDSVTRAKLICLGLWGLAIAPQLALPPMFNTFSYKNHTRCLSFNQTGLTRPFAIWSITELVLGFMLPLCLMVFYHARIAHTLLGKAMCTRVARSRHRAARFLFTVQVIFAICFFPVHASRTMLVVVSLLFPNHCNLMQASIHALYSTMLLSNCNCLLDPLLLYISGDRLRQAAVSALRRLRFTQDQA